MATAKKREEQPIEKKRPWGPVKEDLCRIWRETLNHGRFPLLITFWMVCQFLQNFWKTPRMPVFYEFPQHFCGILFIYSLCWFVIYSFFCPGVGVLSHVPCPMWGFSKCAGPTFIHWYMWWRGHAWNCTDCMKHKISLVGFCCCCCCFLSLLHLHRWFGICCWEGRGGGVG